MYYVRCRPYWDPDKWEETLLRPAPAPESGEYFFKSGREGLSFLIHAMKSVMSRNPRVAVQAFICPAVIRTLLASGAEVILTDIELGCFSTHPEDFFGRYATGIDLVILTHLFGVPNPWTLEWVSRCRKAGIWLLEDRAHTPMTHAGSKLFDLDGDAGLFSFAYDKPIACGGGGLFKASPSMAAAFGFNRIYNKIPLLSEKKETETIFKNGKWWKMSEPLIAVAGMRTCTKPIWTERLGWPVIQRPTRLHRIPEYVRSIWPAVEAEAAMTRRSWDAARGVIARVPGYDAGWRFPDEPAFARWHRPPVLCGRNPDVLIRWGQQRNIELGAFNWPVGAVAGEIRRCGRDPRDFPNSIRAASELVNVPVWSEAIWEKLS